MIDFFIVIVILPKIISLLLLCNMLYIFRRMRRKNHVEPWIYFGIGMTGYNVFVSWTSGWLQHLELFMMLLCVVGMFAMQAHGMLKMRKDVKQWDTHRQCIDTMLQRMYFVYAQWDRGELSDNEFDVLLQDMRQEREKQRMQEKMLMR